MGFCLGSLAFSARIFNGVEGKESRRDCVSCVLRPQTRFEVGRCSLPRGSRLHDQLVPRITRDKQSCVAIIAAVTSKFTARSYCGHGATDSCHPGPCAGAGWRRNTRPSIPFVLLVAEGIRCQRQRLPSLRRRPRQKPGHIFVLGAKVSGMPAVSRSSTPRWGSSGGVPHVFSVRCV